MYIVYVDESGKPDLSDSENFVLSAVIINESEWFGVHGKVVELKEKWFPKAEPEEIELHTSDIVSGNRSYYSMKVERRFEFLGGVYELIANSPIDLVSVVIVKDRIKKKRFDVEAWALRFLYERLSLYLIGANRDIETTSGHAEFGIMFMDSVGAEWDRRVREKMTKYLRKGTMYVGETEYLIEDVLFVESHLRSLSQLADNVAYCVRRKLRSSDTWKDQYFEGFFDTIAERFVKDENGDYEGWGLKVFPQK